MTRRVLLVGSYLSRTGSTSRSVGEELGLGLEARGWRTLLTSHRPSRAARLLDMTTTAWRARADYDVALVEVYSGLAFTWAEAVCAVLRRARKPIVLALHGGNLPTFASRWPGRVRRLLTAADAVVAPSTYLQASLHSYRADIGLLPNALDLQAYTSRERSPAAPRLIWLRAFHALYRPWDAVEVLARLVATHPQATLCMVGPDKGDGSLARSQETARRLGVVDRVTWVGAVPKPEVPAWLARGDVFLNTTTADNTPVSVLEALATGLLVVSTDVGGLRHLLTHEQNALLVPRADPDAMAAAVTRLLGDSALAAKLSRAGRALAATCDWEAVLDRWEALLGGLTSRHATVQR